MADGQECRATDETLASYTKHVGLQVKVTTVEARAGYASVLTESSNMLHYSNASSIEKNRRYLVIKGGGLAWKLCCTRRVVGDIVVLGGISAGLGVYMGRRGGKKK